jgi:acyl carrier protein
VVPSLLASILERWPDLGRQLPALRFWVSSGEALRPALVERFRTAHPGARLYNLYGTSEVWDATWFDTGQEVQLGSRVPIGFPIANVRTQILDSHGQMVPIGVAGELHVGGAAVGQGYLRRPDLTAARFVPDPFPGGSRLYRTGDRARYRADGAIELIDRMDRQVKIRGHRVEVDEIETLVRQCPGIRDAAIVARESHGGDVRLVAFVAGSDGADASTWRESLRRRVPEHMIPVRFIHLDALPMTPSGKVDRQALAALPDEAAPVRERANNRACSPMETALCELCAEVFGLDRVGVDDHFFMDLGGHSLLATRLVARIRDRFGVDLPLRLVFEQPTMAGLARALSANGGATPRAPTIQRAPRHRQIVQISDRGVLEALARQEESAS